jgi:hypothetical protein
VIAVLRFCRVRLAWGCRWSAAHPGCTSVQQLPYSGCLGSRVFKMSRAVVTGVPPVAGPTPRCRCMVPGQCRQRGTHTARTWMQQYVSTDSLSEPAATLLLWLLWHCCQCYSTCQQCLRQPWSWHAWALVCMGAGISIGTWWGAGRALLHLLACVFVCGMAGVLQESCRESGSHGRPHTRQL